MIVVGLLPVVASSAAAKAAENPSRAAARCMLEPHLLHNCSAAAALNCAGQTAGRTLQGFQLSFAVLSMDDQLIDDRSIASLHLFFHLVTSFSWSVARHFAGPQHEFENP